MITKKQPRRGAARQTLTVSQLEKMLLMLPAQILKMIKQETVALKRTDSQLKQMWAQLGKQIKKNMPRKQAVQLNKRSQTIAKQLKETAKHIQLALQKQDKILHLKKWLTQFEKEWATKLKTAHTQTARSVKQRVHKKTKPAADALSQAKLPSIDKMISVQSTDAGTIKNPAQTEQKELESVEA